MAGIPDETESGEAQLPACPVAGSTPFSDADCLGCIVRLDRSPDGNPDRDLIHVADGRGGLVIMPVAGVCPCLEAVLNIVGHRIGELPPAIRTVYSYCRQDQYKLCPRYPTLCSRPAYLEHLRRHLENHPDYRDALTDLPL